MNKLREIENRREKQLLEESKIICNWCGVRTQIIWVHGHGQCGNCRMNIEECCRGEVCQVDPKTNTESEKR